MSKINNRVRHEDAPPSSSTTHNRRKRKHGRSQSPISYHSPEEGKCKRPSFISYLNSPNLSPKLKIFCEIVARSSPLDTERALQDTLLRVCSEDVEEVLKLSYGHPSGVVKFFRWAGHQLGDRHSPYSWNLLVDLLGKNSLFDAMWDAIQSMSDIGLISLSTFASVFSSYVMVDRVHDAIKTFESMDRYGCARDAAGLNTLLSAVCRDGKTKKADEYLRFVKSEIIPDTDSYAILLEGWEREGNVDSARGTFREMTKEIGWDPGNVPAYDSFLCTLLKGRNGLHEAMKCFNEMRERKCTPGYRFFQFALEGCVKKNDVRGASLLWEAMTMRNLITRPNTHLYNQMITLHCGVGNPRTALKFLDEMLYDGSFPDTSSYNMLLKSLIKRGDVREALVIFNETVRNEFIPNPLNCIAAISLCLEMGDAYGAIKVWKFMADSDGYRSELGEIGDSFIVGLCNLDKVPEAAKYADYMIDQGIKLDTKTVSKLKQVLIKKGKGHVYDELFRKWKEISA